MNFDDARNVDLLKQIDPKLFRVAIFGSARIKPEDLCYKMTYELAKMLGEHNFGIVTGGGPGIMEAANKGHRDGTPDEKIHHSKSIGLTIRLPQEKTANPHLDIHKHFDKFSDRLDNFMAISNVAVVMPGGIGTCLELFYAWQLTQVKHICDMPIIVLGEMWEKLIQWLKTYPLKDGYVNEHDMMNVLVARSNEDVMKIILKVYEVYQKEGDSYCLNYKKYKLV